MLARGRKAGPLLASYLPWSKIVSGPEEEPAPGDAPTQPTVLQNKNGLLMSVLRYRGPDVAMLDTTGWRVYLQGWNHLGKRMGEGWAMWADEWHEPARAYPRRRGTNPTAAFVDLIRRNQYEEGHLYETEHFLTVGWHPPSAWERTWLDSVFVRQAQTRSQGRDISHLVAFRTALDKFGDAASSLLPMCRWASPKQTVTYLHRGVSWDRHPIAVPTPPTFLDRTLSAGCGVTHGQTPMLGRRLLRPVTIRHWKEGIGMYIPLLLQQLPFPYRFTMRHLFLSTAQATQVLNGLRRRWEIQVLPLWVHALDAWNGTKTDWEDPLAPVNEEARQYAYALKRAIASVKQGDVAYGYGTPTILVWSDTACDPEEPETIARAKDELRTRERAVLKLLQGEELIFEPETTNATRAWLGMQAGNTWDNVRNVPLSTEACAFLLPHGAVWAGPEWDARFQGPPAIYTGSQGHPFRVALNQGDVGNWMIKGPTRSGKSAWMSLLGSQILERYGNSQVYAFDDRLQLYCATVLHGGAHYNLGSSGTRGFHPLAQLQRGQGELLWAQGWLQDILATEGAAPNAAEREQMWLALEKTAKHPRPERRISTFVRYLQVQRLKEVLKPYCEGGRYSFFDAAQDSFALGNRWTTFEMGDLLAFPDILPHAMSYVFHRMESTFDGRPTVVIFDEGWQYYNHPVFRGKIGLYLKGRSKDNVSLVLSSQEVVDSRYSELWQAIQGSVRTWLFLPNKAALNADVLPHYTACGLSQAHTSLLAQATVYQDYLYKSEEGVRMFQCRLTPLERWLVAASKPEEIAALQALVASEPSEPLVVAWLRQGGFHEEADVYQELAAA